MSALLDLLRADPNVSGAFKDALGLTRALDACTADFKAANDAAAREQHLRDREEELSNDLCVEWHERAPTRSKMRCGCEARLEDQAHDGERSHSAWAWIKECELARGEA